MAMLAFLKGVKQGSRMELRGDKVVLGRNGDCDIVFDVAAVSRVHAVIRHSQGQYTIEDMKSHNKTYVNKKEVTARTLLKDRDEIKICDNVMTFYESSARVPLPPEMTALQATVEDDQDSSKVRATISGDSKHALESQPAERLAMLLELSAELSQTFDPKELFTQILDRLFKVFRQADRAFLILEEDGILMPKAVRTRSTLDEGEARFSRRIVRQCMGTGESILSEDVDADFGDLAHSISGIRIRSIMLAPLRRRNGDGAFGVIQLDTQDPIKRFTPDDLKLLLAVAGQMAVALEMARMYSTMLARASLEQDLERARQVQRSFLPKSLPRLPGYSFFAFYESAQEVGGDYYDFIPFPGGTRLAVMLGDVAGKGMPAALLMAKVNSSARLCSLTEKTLSDAMSRLNDQMQEASLLDRFVTLGACIVDQTRHDVDIANAGHLPLLVYRKATDTIEEAHSRDLTGLPLGIAPSFPYETTTLTLEPGDFMVLFSDGVPDARNSADKEFHNEGVLNALRAGPMTVEAAGQRLVTAVQKHHAGCKQGDDITIVCFGRVGE